MRREEAIDFNSITSRSVGLPDISHSFYVYIEQQQEEDISPSDIMENMDRFWSKTQIVVFIEEILEYFEDVDINKAVVKIARGLLAPDDLDAVNAESPPLQFESEI